MQAAAGIGDQWALMRRVLIVLFAAATATLALALVAPDPDTSDHLADTIVGGCTAAITVLLSALRRPPTWLLRLAPLVGTAVISVVVATSAPLTDTAFFYLWPLLLSAYFLSRLEAFVNFAAMCAGYGAALALGVEPGVRATLFLEATVTMALVTALVVMLKERLVGALAHMRETATRDPLTGVANRRAFEWVLEREVDRAHRSGIPVALVIADLDRFKLVNDRFGHAGGDRALQRFTEIVQSRLRRVDLMARIGGEEFAVVLPDTHCAGGLAFAERLTEAVRLETARDEAPLTMSAGVAACPASAGTQDELMRAADRALYAAKRAGRDRAAASGEPGERVSA